MKDVVGSAIVAVPVVNEVTDQGIINALALEHSVWLGLTYGAWFKIGMGIALVLLIVERGLSIYSKLKTSKDKGDSNEHNITEGLRESTKGDVSNDSIRVHD